MSLQYLRCLGSSISDLWIWCDGWNENQCKHIHQYVNKYCAESLVQIEWFGVSSRIYIDLFEQPFMNVQIVKVVGCNLGDQLPLFQKYFPNIHTLYLSDVQVDTLRPIKTQFYHLQELRIHIDHRSRDFTVSEATHLLQICPRLQSLEIIVFYNFKVSVESVINIFKDNRAICTLKINGNSSDVNTTNIQQIVSEHPSLVDLELNGLNITSDGVISLIRQLGSLKRFHFRNDNRSVYNQLLGRLDSQWNLRLKPVYPECFVELER